MIITRLSGGLGNQMFQYAMGRALSLRNNTDLCIDTSSYASLLSGEAPRHFTLQHFNIAAPSATPFDYAHLGLPGIRDRCWLARTRRKLFRMRESFIPLQRRRFIVEPHYAFVPDAYAAGPDCLLSGIWQSPYYFDDAKEAIRRDFTLKDPFSPEASRILADVRSQASVSLHVRRGDYVSHAKTNDKHGACSPDYYHRAIEFVRSREPAARFFVFSDDIAWARENLPMPNGTTFVSRPGLPDYEELMLMSSCRHHILANSSFSWWAAWLNENPEKIVIAPEKWFAGNTDTKDLIPTSWTRL